MLGDAADQQMNASISGQRGQARADRSVQGLGDGDLVKLGPQKERVLWCAHQTCAQRSGPLDQLLRGAHVLLDLGGRAHLYTGSEEHIGAAA